MKVSNNWKIGLLIILAIVSIGIVSGTDYLTNSQSNFNEGTYVNTFFNISYVQGNYSFSSGTYTSKIFDAGKNAEWNSINWTQGLPYGQELPNNNVNENAYNGANMSGNILLVHLNNDADESSTLFKDNSGYSNNGSCSSFRCPSLTTGKYGNAYDFDGSNDRMEFGDPTTLDSYKDELTLEAWVKPDSFVDTPTIVEKSYADQYSLYFRDEKTIRANVVTSSGYKQITGTKVHSAGNWYHVVFTYDGSQMKVYSNGVQDGSAVSASGDIASSSKGLLIGAGWEGSSITYEFNGIIDEVAVYNRSLSASEVLDHYKRGAIRLNLSARSCDDGSCSGESFTELNITPSQSLGLSNNKYFQYRVNFTTEDTNYPGEMHNLTISYSTINLVSNITLNAPNNNSITTNNYTMLNATVYDNDLDNMTFWLYGDGSLLNTSYNQTNNTEINYNWTDLNNGGHTWYVVSNDGTENVSSSLYDFTINYTAPNNEPSISINNPTNNSVLGVNSAFLNASLFDNDLDNLDVWVYGNGSLLTSFTGKTNNTEVTYNWTGLSDSAYNWSVIVNDGEGNVSLLSFFTINATVPNTSPNVTLNYPNNDSNFSTNSVVLNATVYDNDLDNLTVWIYGDNAVLNTSYNQTNNTEITYNWTGLTDGSHNWSVVVNDGSENVTSSLYEFLINTTSPNTVPEINLNLPSNNTEITVNNTLLNFTVYDNDLNNLTVWIYGDNAVLNTSYNQTNNTEITYNWTNLSNGNYTWYVVSNDGSENVTSNQWMFTINVAFVNTSSSTSAGDQNNYGGAYEPYPSALKEDSSDDASDDTENTPTIPTVPKVAKQEPPKALFDIQFHVDEKSKEIKSGQNIVTTVSLINFGDAGKIVTNVVYVIKDSEGKIVYETSDEINVETQNEYVKTLSLPSELKPGVYSIGVTLEYGDGQEAYSEDTFVITEDVIIDKYNLLGILLLCIATFSLAFFVYLFLRKKDWKLHLPSVQKDYAKTKIKFKKKDDEFYVQKKVSSETMPKDYKPIKKDVDVKEPYYAHNEDNPLKNYTPSLKKLSVRDRLEKLQQQNIKTISHEKSEGVFKTPIKRVETYLYPHDKEIVKERLKRLKKRTMSYKPLLKETMPKKDKKQPPKNIEDLGLED